MTALSQGVPTGNRESVASADTSPASLRRANGTRILRILSAGGTHTASSLIERTGLTRTTVLAVCDDLIGGGWVQELGTARSNSARAGRPARQMELAWRAAYVVGIDVGVFHSTVLLADLGGEVVARSQSHFRHGEATTASSRLVGVDKAVRKALQIAGVSPELVLGVGMGVAAPVSRDGEVPVADAFWRGFGVGNEGLPSLPGVGVLIDNDANLAARAELWRGAAQGARHAAVVLAGRRLGSGIVEDGRVLHGHRGGSGELGFLYLVRGVGGSEGIAWLAETWGRESAADEAGMLHDLCHGDPRKLTSEDVFAAAAAGDRAARKVTRRIADRMARVIGVVATITDPEVVVIAGAIAPSAAQLLPDLLKNLGKYVRLQPRVLASELGEDVVALGAVRVALDDVIERAVDLRVV